MHPILVLLPIGFWSSTLFCDIGYAVTNAEGWAISAMWLLGAAIVAALLAALAGLTDFLGDRRIRALNDAWQHAIGNVIAVVLALINFALRAAEGPGAAVVPWGLTLSVLVACVLLFTGWKGGELTFRHRVGVHESGEEWPRPRVVSDSDQPTLH